MNITIVGLGTVGISLGLALKAIAPDVTITGHDPDPERAKRAQDLGAIGKRHWNLPAACEGADLVLLDLPLSEMEKTLGPLGEVLQEGAVVLDVCPLKGAVMEMAARLLPPHVSFIGGDLLSPKVCEGVAPSVDLVRGAIFFLVPSPRASAEALERVSDFVEAVGARPHYIEAAEHDSLIAAMVQAPAMCALALFKVVEEAAGARERRYACGPAFAALAQILSTTAVEGEALRANRERLVYWLDAILAELGRVRAALTTDVPGLAGEIERARQTAQAWLQGPEAEGAPPPQEGAPDWRQMWLGNLGRKPKR